VKPHEKVSEILYTWGGYQVRTHVSGFPLGLWLEVNDPNESTSRVHKNVIDVYKDNTWLIHKILTVHQKMDW
jgi:hypothetical protein